MSYFDRCRRLRSQRSDEASHLALPLTRSSSTSRWRKRPGLDHVRPVLARQSARARRREAGAKEDGEQGAIHGGPARARSAAASRSVRTW